MKARAKWRDTTRTPRKEAVNGAAAADEAPAVDERSAPAEAPPAYISITSITTSAASR